MFNNLFHHIKQKSSNKKGNIENFILIFGFGFLFCFTLMFSFPKTDNFNNTPQEWTIGTIENIYVKDEANMLSDNAKQKINKVSSQLETRTKAQIVVMTVDSLNNQDYSFTDFSELGLDNKDSNNVILILIAKDDKQINIKIGSGLKSVISNSKAYDIANREMIPAFKQGEYESGIMAGYLFIVNEVNKKTYNPY